MKIDAKENEESGNEGEAKRGKVSIKSYIFKLLSSVELTIELGRVQKQTKSQECKFINNVKQ